MNITKKSFLTIMTSQQRRIEPPVHDGPLEKDAVVPAAMQQPDPADSQRLLADRINICKNWLCDYE